ncbi:endo-1,3;1,4-beta-D-glucanase-like [Vicia villosa]|uniref:endo-1,3;1,4-beta-D-glucanase-like n=1 Tax=Vicia villosa TaxID=3911 RepID=UPI00273C8799|nr:endo-1,3;1,4-beta-D-glucanase-like [Vicia villosa]
MSSSHCVKNPPNMNSGFNGVGTVLKLGGLKSYVTGPPHSKLTLFLSHFRVRSTKSKENKTFTDKLSTSGFLVVVPDLLYGDYFDIDNPQFDRAAWINVHGTDKGSEDTKPLIAALKSKGVTSIGAAGFCWGGVVVTKLGVSNDFIQAAVILHPGPITDKEFNDIRVPIAFLGAEIDEIFPKEKLKQVEELLSAKAEIESLVKLYPGTTHGWSTKYNVEDEVAVKNAEEAHEDVLNWFIKYVN